MAALYDTDGTYIGDDADLTMDWAALRPTELTPSQLGYGYTFMNDLVNGGIPPIQASGEAGSAYTESGKFNTGVQGALTTGQEADAYGPGRGVFQWEASNNLANGTNYSTASGRGDAFRLYMDQTGFGKNPDGT